VVEEVEPQKLVEEVEDCYEKLVEVEVGCCLAQNVTEQRLGKPAHPQRVQRG
jgi:hypothetical protein